MQVTKQDAFHQLLVLRAELARFALTKRFRVPSDFDGPRKRLATVRKLVHPWEKNTYARVNGQPERRNFFWSKV